MLDTQLHELSKRLSPFVVGSEGNISCLTPSGFLIKQSGKSILEKSFVMCDLDGKPVGNNKPSMEVDFHSWIYRNSTTLWIAHTHPVNTLKILCSPQNILKEFAINRLFPDQVVFNGARACLVPYSTPGRDLTYFIKQSIIEHTNLYGDFPDLLLLKNHGIVACGHTAEQVATITEICEKSAEIFLGCIKRDFLTGKDVERILNSEDEKYRHDNLR